MKTKIHIVTVLLLCLLSTPVFADYGYSTVIYGYGWEPSHATILGDTYGGTFTGSGTDLGDGLWTIFSNDSITASRVYDFDGEDEIINLFNGNQTNVDQIWSDGMAKITAEARYGELGQSFGWNGGGLGTDDYYEILTNADIGNGPVEIPIHSEQFLWGIRPGGVNKIWSKNSCNADGDHLVTYHIDGASLNGETVWMLFWEDAVAGDDYQDFVVEVRAIPEPNTLLLLGLGGLLLRKRKV